MCFAFFEVDPTKNTFKRRRVAGVPESRNAAGGTKVFPPKKPLADLHRAETCLGLPHHKTSICPRVDGNDAAQQQEAVR